MAGLETTDMFLWVLHGDNIAHTKILHKVETKFKGVLFFNDAHQPTAAEYLAHFNTYARQPLSAYRCSTLFPHFIGSKVDGVKRYAELPPLVFGINPATDVYPVPLNEKKSRRHYGVISFQNYTLGGRLFL